MNKIEQEILKQIKPPLDEEQKVDSTIKSFLAQLKISNVEVGGSVARGTWLNPVGDIDVFVKYDPKKNKNEQIAKKLGTEVKKNFDKYEIVHGSRDYYQVEFEGITFELIPVMDISRSPQAQNTTDLSPLHVKWQNKNTDLKLRDEIRLAKQFCRANGVYGAESYINGFSGYVLEILLVHYGSFSKFVKAIVKWEDKTIIDVEKHYNQREALVRLNQSKIQSPLIVVDPTWPERNAAAALSKESFDKFKKICSKYVKSPKKKYFEVKEFDVEKELKNYDKKNYFVLEIIPNKGNNDVEGTKILKIYEKILKRLERFEYKIKKAGWQFGDKATLWFVVEKGSLSPKKKHFGPPKKLENRVEEFKKRWKGKELKFEKGISYVVIKRKYPNLDKFVESTLKKEFVTKRADKIKRV